MTPSQACFNLCETSEGYAKLLPGGDCEAYPDPASGGKPYTIGFGSTGPDIHLGLAWTRVQAIQRMQDDMARIAASVTAIIGNSPITQGQFDAFCDFSYNEGTHALATSTLMVLHKMGNYAEAVLQFGRWDIAAGKIMAGLETRRAAEAAMYRGE